MPETRETTTGGKVCKTFLEDHPDVPVEEDVKADRTTTQLPMDNSEAKAPAKKLMGPPEERILISLHADAVEKELRYHKPESPASSGLPYELTSWDSGSLRGYSGANQKPLYPPMYTNPKNHRPISEKRLAFTDVVLDSRNYILKFVDKDKNDCWVQIQPLTHTSVQIYTMDQWDKAISKISKELRGFKIAIAFKFKTHVMAFLTLDMVFQVTWAPSREKLPVQYADVYMDPEGYLKQITDWMLKRRGGAGVLRPKARTRNALAVIKETHEIHGVGQYSAPEVLFLAGTFSLPASLLVTQTVLTCTGVSPTISEEDLFDSPSMTARLLAAYYEFARVGHFELWALVQRHMYGYVTAVSTKDRLHYAEFLRVWGKDRTFISERQSRLLDARNEKTSKFDAFEPELIRHALTVDKCNLGSLIFGTELWQKLSLSAGLPSSTCNEDNPLAKYYKRNHIKAKPSRLDPTAYDFLFHSNKIGRTLTPTWRPVFCFRLLVDKSDVWTLYNEPEQHDRFTPIVGEERERRLLNFKTQHTNVQTVGPLDFCGTARLVSGRGKDVMLVCEGDPTKSTFYVKRRILEKETIKLKGRGTEHSGIPADIKKRKLREFYPQSGGDSLQAATTILPSKSDTTLCPTSSQEPPKKKRRSADRDMAKFQPIIQSTVRASRSRRNA
ncbi:hypothetical protein GALMADRAFT_148649 [Galerina marginata CBS 339.88]|uniref:Uncharacterized protein n=1 Tax=Galerina marginata (strain CBS 339.88) TaxID=685588 RepID=A0A067SCQ2_GALM3|nr:hypothetical protein GALMADRAFT_148649 [Galerina marginata CBS 339.88]